MPAINTNGDGMTLSPVEPMIPGPGPNISPNAAGLPNVSSYFVMGANQQNLATIRGLTISTGFFVGGTGTHSAYMLPVTGSGKYILQGAPVTRLTDLGTVNNNNSIGVQSTPSQSKYFVLS